nr:hypothetical protein [Streptomyces sp. TRM68416]
MLAVLTFLLPVSAKSTPASRPSSAGTATTGTSTTGASTTGTPATARVARATAPTPTPSTADAQRAVTVAHPVLGHADSVPHPSPYPGFVGPAAGDTAPHRAVGGPAVAVAAAEAEAGRGTDPRRPRGPPSPGSTEVRIDA